MDRGALEKDRMNLLVLFIFAAIILSGLLNIYLERRQGLSAIVHRDRVPGPFVGQVSPEEHRRAADYTLARSRLAIAQIAFDTLLAVIWLGFLLRPLDAVVSQLVAPGLSRSVAIVVAVAGVDYLLNLPFAIYRTFRLEAAFDFNRTTPAIFALDRVKAAALQLALGVPLLYALFALLRAFPNFWWIFGWAGLMIIM